LKIIRNQKKIWVGGSGLLLFSLILGFWLSPRENHRSGLERVDQLFNQMAKNSTYFIPDALKLAQKFEGTTVDFGVHSRWPGEDARMAQVLQTNRFSAMQLGDGRVRIKGDLGLMGKSASLDAELLFKDRDSDLRAKYGGNEKEAIYYWWVAFDGLTRRFIQENRSREADFTRFMTTRILEPAYNFAGIETKSIGENVGKVAFFLSFYLLYTLLYGFSILFLFEGLGIQATKSKEKKEA
jgi:hypothetical protein